MGVEVGRGDGVGSGMVVAAWTMTAPERAEPRVEGERHGGTGIGDVYVWDMTWILVLEMGGAAHAREPSTTSKTMEMVEEGGTWGKTNSRGERVLGAHGQAWQSELEAPASVALRVQIMRGVGWLGSEESVVDGAGAVQVMGPCVGHCDQIASLSVRATDADVYRGQPSPKAENMRDKGFGLPVA